MPEIINLQVGQCGIQIGTAFWNVITEEHGIQPDGVYEGTTDHQLKKLNVFFNESKLKGFSPRTVMVDLDPESMHSIRASTFGNIFRDDNFIFSRSGAYNNWARGHYTEGVEIIGHVQDVLRREAEDCDCLHGFQLMHSLGGGTGSGLGTLLLSSIRDEYPDRIINTYSVGPSTKIQDANVSPYNVLLSFQQLIRHADSTFCFDNQALYEICQKIVKLSNINYADLNHVVSEAMSGITTTLRYPAHLNSDLRKLAMNMVPYPRLHFITTSFAPLISNDSKIYHRLPIPEVVCQMFDSRNVLADCNPLNGRYLTVAANFRGSSSKWEVEKAMLNIQTNVLNFIDWIPNNIKTFECEIPLKYIHFSGTFLANNTAIHEIFKRTSSQFARMFKRKAFLQWYISEGMEESEFVDAYDEVLDLVSEYQQFESTEAPEANLENDGR